MHCRALRILILCFTAVWFGVLVPVHPRGMIPVPGDARAAAGPCCVADAPGPVPPARRGEGTPPMRRSCAVCQWVVGLDVPSPVLLDAPPLQPGATLAVESRPRSFRPPTRFTCQERGPPPEPTT